MLAGVIVATIGQPVRATRREPAFSRPLPWTVESLTWQGHPAKILTIPRGWRVVPHAHRPGRTVFEWLRFDGVVAAINGGYFNHSDGFPVSHVFAGRTLADPTTNQALKQNQELRPILSRILNKRATWTSVGTPEGVRWEIRPYDQTRNRDRFGKIAGLLQAGPALLPAMDLAEEGFVIKGKNGAVIRDGIASSTPAARSAIGLRPDGAMIWAVVGSRPGGGVTIAQLGQLMAESGATSAMALDGGSSSSLSWRESPHAQIQTFVGSGGAPARVNSVLLLVLPGAHTP